MDAKAEVLRFIGSVGRVDSAMLMERLGYETRGGAALTLLRHHRHGHLLRVRVGLVRGTGYRYSLREKGRRWLEWYDS